MEEIVEDIYIGSLSTINISAMQKLTHRMRGVFGSIESFNS